MLSIAVIITHLSLKYYSKLYYFRLSVLNTAIFRCDTLIGQVKSYSIWNVTYRKCTLKPVLVCMLWIQQIFWLGINSTHYVERETNGRLINKLRTFKNWKEILLLIIFRWSYVYAIKIRFFSLRNIHQPEYVYFYTRMCC